MELKQAGLSPTHCVLAQGAQFTFPNCDQGTENEKGLVASGPVSFAKIYSTLNEILRRGGVYKNGAVVCHLDLSHPDALEFIQTPRSELPWVKRCINIKPEWWEACTFKEALLHGIKSGDIWLNKVKYDEEGNRIRGNVCLEATCPHEVPVYSKYSLGAQNSTTSLMLFGRYVPVVRTPCKTGVGESGEYLPSETDRQVGLGMLDSPTYFVDTE